MFYCVYAHNQLLHLSPTQIWYWLSQYVFLWAFLLPTTLQPWLSYTQYLCLLSFVNTNEAKTLSLIPKQLFVHKLVFFVSLASGVVFNQACKIGGHQCLHIVYNLLDHSLVPVNGQMIKCICNLYMALIKRYLKLLKKIWQLKSLGMNFSKFFHSWTTLSPKLVCWADPLQIIFKVTD